MSRQFVEGGDLSRIPISDVLENGKEEEGRYGGGIEPRFKCLIKGEWVMVNGEFLTRITLILRMARIGEREGKGTINNREACLFTCR